MKAIELSKKIYENFGNGNLPGVLDCLSDQIEWELIGPKSIPYFGISRETV